MLYQENYIESEELDYDEEVEIKRKQEEKETRINNKHSSLIVTSKYKQTNKVLLLLPFLPL